MSPARLNPFPAVEVGGVRILVDRNRPVAVLQSDGSNRFVTWPNAPLPPTAAKARLVTAPDGVWVVYEEASEEPPAASSCTAVRIGVDAVASGVAIGPLRVIGADSEGVWASPSPSPSPEPYPGEGEDLADEGRPWDFDGEDLPLEPWDEFQKQQQQWSAEDFAKQHEKFVALQAARRESDGDDNDDHVLGWFAFGGIDESEEQPPRFEAPPAPGPSSPVELTRYRVDGRTETVTVDRTVAALEQEGSLTVVTFFPTNPIGTVEQDGYVLGYSYPMSRIVVDFSTGLPSTLAVGEYEATALPLNDEWEEMWAADSPKESAIPADDRIELESVPGIEWALAEISQEAIDAAVDSVVEQLEALAEPHVVWTRRDDKVHRVESPYRDLSVRVEGAWPATVVAVEFHHREYSDVMYRRRYRVFDSSGRPINRQYMTVHLEEDMATGHHPAERDGVIDFLDD